MTVEIIRDPKSRRLRSPKDLQHKPDAQRPAGDRKGKWHSRASLWAYKRKSRKARLVAKASRRINRQRAAA